MAGTDTRTFLRSIRWGMYQWSTMTAWSFAAAGPSSPTSPHAIDLVNRTAVIPPNAGKSRGGSFLPQTRRKTAWRACGSPPCSALVSTGKRQ